MKTNKQWNFVLKWTLKLMIVIKIKYKIIVKVYDENDIKTGEQK